MKRLIVCLSLLQLLIDNAKIVILGEVTMKSAPEIYTFDSPNFHFNISLTSHLSPLTSQLL